MTTKVDRSGYLFSNKALVSLIIPLVIEQILGVLVGMMSTVMVSGLGEAAVSGVSVVETIMFLLIGLFGALATGGAVIAGQYLGLGDRKSARESANQLVYLSVFIAIIAMILTYVGHRFLLGHIFGAMDAEVMQHADRFLLIVAPVIPFVALYNVCAALFRSQGNSKIPMLVTLLMNVLNIGGNAILVFGFGMGTEGVAIATLVARSLAAVVIAALLCNKKYEIYITFKRRFKPNWKMIRRVLKIGIPSGIENSMFQVGKIVLLTMLAGFGTSAIAANAVGNIVFMIHVIPIFAIAMAMTPIVAQCIGAGAPEQAVYYMRKMMIISYSVIVVWSGVIWLLIPTILRIYNLSSETAAVTRQIIYIILILGITVFPFSVIIPAVLRGAGDVKFVMYVTIGAMWICRIGVSYLLAVHWEMGIFGIWLALTFDWVGRGIFFIYRYCRGKWKTIKSI